MAGAATGAIDSEDADAETARALMTCTHLNAGGDAAALAADLETFPAVCVGACLKTRTDRSFDCVAMNEPAGSHATP